MQNPFRIISPLLLVTLILSGCSYNAWLDWHNIYRCMHGVPDLQWSSTLQEVATWRAKNCQTCDHCICPQNDTSCYDIHKKLYAENASCQSGTAEQVVKGWYDEIINYDYNNPQWSNTPGKKTGHFINVIASTATKVGCACETNHCYCDYDTLYSKSPPTSQELTQIIPKPIKTLAECRNSTP